MYHLTCPTCHSETASPFVRSGAVVRCESCDNKYRIKTAHIERVLTTGPRTLDEAESLLRSDSVDIDPDEASPVSIDDEGNVVGLSGLSELMRQSDVRGTEAKVQSRMQAAPPPPTAHRPGAAAGDEPPGVVRLPDEPAGASRSSRRARLQAKKRRKRMQAMLIAALGVLVVVSGVVLYVVVDRQKTDTATNGDADQGDAGKSPDGDNPGNGSDATGPDTPGPIVEPELFANLGKPEPNPDPQYVEPVVVIDPNALPEDVPTVVIPARPIAHEGWYITTPPRGAADAGGEADFAVSELTPSTMDDGRTMLNAAVSNSGQYAMIAGELHLMLLDGSGGVFAETFMPLNLIAPGGEQAIALPIPTRHWQRQRGVRTSIKVTSRTKNLYPIPDVKLDPVGTAEHTALRISVRHNGLNALRGVLILIEATDAQGNRLARFVVEDEQLYVDRGAWLDLVVATPMGGAQQPAQWSAVIQPR